MTLCIAAAADYNGEPCTILCHDRRVETDLFGSETMDKSGSLAKGVLAMVAGSPRAIELAGIYRNFFEQNPVAEKRFSARDLKRPFYSHKRRMIDEYLNETLGISRKWFYENGRSRFPENVFQNTIAEIKQVTSGASLIICAFSSVSSPPGRLICVVDENNRRNQYESPVCFETNFAAIGSGALLALASLHKREHTEELPLKLALYHVLEAKRHGDQTPGVGFTTTIQVLCRDGSTWGISPKAEGFLESSFARYGPKDIDPDQKDWLDSSGLLVKQSDHFAD